MKRFLLAIVVISQVAKAVEPKILFEEDPTLLTSTIQVVVTTGSADDPAGKNGLSNLMGELIVRGTKKRDRAKFQSEVERMGATLYVRASHDSIVFVGRVIKENTQAFLKLLAETLLQPAFSKKEFESLKTEVLAEIANMKNSNGRLSGLALRRNMMAGTVLERPNEGSLSSVKGITLEDIQRGYNDRFSRGNFVFGVASPLKEAELKKPLLDLWLGFPDGAHRARKSIPPQVPKSPTIIVVQKPKTSTGAIMFGQAGITASDPTRYPLAVGNYAFGGEPLISRLFRIIRSDLGWTYAIGSTYHGAGHLSNQQGIFVISSTPAVEYTAKTILKLLSMWQEYLKNGLKDDELKLARESLVNSYPFEFDSAEKRLWQRLYSFLYSTPLYSQDEYKKVIEAIDNKKIKESLAEKQASQGWIITVVADKAVVEKQLEEEQKDVPAEKRLTVSKQMTPEELVQ